MSEIEDLNNKVLALTHKIDSVLKTLDVLRSNNEKLNEVLNIIHNMNFERSKEHNSIFNAMFPDIIRRITDLENDKRKVSPKNEMFSKSIEVLPVSTRIIHILRAEEINTIGELVCKTQHDIIRYNNFGRKSLTELNKALENIGLSLKY